LKSPAFATVWYGLADADHASVRSGTVSGVAPPKKMNAYAPPRKLGSPRCSTTTSS
jgi:hypothetical protein